MNLVSYQKFSNLSLVSLFSSVFQLFINITKLKPNIGQVILNNGGTPPRPWDIPVKPKQMFHNHKLYIEVPNTAKVKVKLKKNKKHLRFICVNLIIIIKNNRNAKNVRRKE